MEYTIVIMSSRNTNIILIISYYFKLFLIIYNLIIKIGFYTPFTLNFNLLYSGSYVKRGQIIATQVGQRWKPSYNTGMGRDYTIYALRNGWVRVYKDPKIGKSFIMVAQDFEANDYQLNRGLPIKRFPHSQVTKVPKLRYFQIKYSLDQRNLGPKTKFRVNYPAPVGEPERITLSRRGIDNLPHEKIRYLKNKSVNKL